VTRFGGTWVGWGVVVAVAVIVLSSGAASAHPATSHLDNGMRGEPTASFSEKNVTVGKNPTQVTYDPKNGDVYVANSNSSSVSVINGASNTVTKTISVGADPIGSVYDSFNGNVYIVSQKTAQVTVLSNSNSVLKTLTVAADPVVAVVAPGGNVFVTCHGTSDFAPGDEAVINASSNAVTEVKVGDEPDVAYYDAASGDMMVPNVFSGTVSAVSKSLTVTTIPTGSGSEPFAMVYSPASKDMYVSLLFAGKIAVIDSANKIVKNITDPEVPFISVYDSVTKYVYVADESNLKTGNVTIINSANAVVETIKTSSPNAPFGFVDPTSGDFYIGTTTGKVLVYNTATKPALLLTLTAAVEPVLILADPSTNDILVLTYAGSGVVGSVVIFSAGNSHLATEKVGKGGTTLTYDSTNKDVYVADFGTNTVSVIT
jgi:YVTN family beta-propeller protein